MKTNTLVTKPTMKAKKLVTTTLVALAATAFINPKSEAALLITQSGTYSQDFNSLPVTATTAPGVTWTNDTTLTGWYSELSNTNSELVGYIRSGNGGLVNGMLWSYGTTGSSDRALGALSSGSVGRVSFGLSFQNAMEESIIFNTISFWGEEWRQNPGTASLLLSYKISSTPITSLDPLSDVGWTSLSSLTFTALQSGTAGALDGNAAANRQYLSSSDLGISLAAGEYIMFRWVNPSTDTNNQFGLAIDDLSISYALVPEPSSFLLFGLGLGVLLARLLRSRRARLG